MKARRITLIDGHPDPDPGRFVHALADAYAAAALAAGHDVRRIAVANLAFDLLESRAEWEEGPLPPTIAEAQADIA